MNIFLEDKLEILNKKDIREMIYSNKRENQLLAIIYDQKIIFYNDQNSEEGETYESEEKITKCKWHPKLNEIIIGTESGGIEIYNPFTSEIKQDEETHSDEITQIHFSKTGEIMITNDKSHQMVFWIDINPVKIEQKIVPVNKIIFVDFSYELDQSKKNIKLGFVGDKLGRIDYFEEKKLVLRELCQVSGSIKEMFFFKRTNTLIVITSTYLLIQYKISTEEDITTHKKVKISMANSSEHLKGLWLSPNSFLLNSKENTLKIWNIEKDKNYQLNLYNYISKKKVEKKLSIIDIKFDSIDVILYVALSNGEIIIFQGRPNEIGEDSSDWKKIGALNSNKIKKNIKKIEINKSNSLLVQYEKEVSIYKKTNIKIFIEKSKNFKLLQKTLNQIEFFVKTENFYKYFSFPYKIKDFLVFEESIVFMNTQRKLIILPLMEIFNSSQRLDPLEKKKNPHIKDRYNKIKIENSIKKVILTKNGYCGIQNSKKMFFMTYKNELLMEYRVSNREEYFIDIITNSNFDKFALINNKYQMKIFATNLKNVKIIYENLNLVNEIKLAEKISLNKELEKNNNNFLFSEEEEKIFDSNNLIEIREKKIIKTKFEKILINESGEIVIMITNKKNNNIILKNLITQKLFVMNFKEDFKIINAIFDSNDDRFLIISVKDKENNKYIIILTTDGNDLRFFDKIKVEEKVYLINSSFPSIFLSYYDDNNMIKIEEKYPNLFKNLFKEENNSIIYEFARNFCLYLSYEKLEKAVSSLKSIEKNFEMKNFWESLLEISLKNRIVNVAELCLKNMKNLRITKLMEKEIKKNKNINSNEKLGIMALSFNKIEIAKKIFFEEKLYSKVCELLFKEENYTKLMKFCKKYDKIFINFYYFKIANKYLEKKNYKRFIEFMKKSKVDESILINTLLKNNKVDLLEKYANSENSAKSKKILFYYYHKRNNEKKSINFLKENKENNNLLSNYYLNVKNDFEKAKLYSSSDKDKNPVCLDFAKNLKKEKNILDAIDYLMKGKYFKKIILFLEENKIYFENNQDIFSSVLDFVYNHAIQKKLISIKAIADFFYSVNFKEKAIKLYIKAKNYRKALMLAEKHNLNNLIPEIEKSFNERKQRIKKKKESLKKAITSSHNFAINSNEAKFNILINNNKFQEGLEFAKKEQFVYKQSQFDKIKMSDFENKKDLLTIIAKKWKKIGKYEKAINGFLDLRDNIQVVKTMIKAQEIPKLIQFANFSRDNTVYELSANFLRTCSVSYNDSLFKAICSFYSKSKNYKKLIQFYLSFIIVPFEQNKLDDCKEVLQKAEKLLERLEDHLKVEFLELINLEKKYLEKFVKSLEFRNSEDNLNELKIYKELISFYDKSKLYNYYNIYFRGLKLSCKLNEKEDIIKYGNFLVKKNKLKFLNNLSQEEIQKIKNYIPDLPENKKRKTSSEDEIEEELF